MTVYLMLNISLVVDSLPNDSSILCLLHNCQSLVLLAFVRASRDSCKESERQWRMLHRIVVQCKMSSASLTLYTLFT